MDADHRGVCKFGHHQDDLDNLELVQGNILDLYEKAVAKGELVALPVVPEIEVAELQTRVAAL